MNTRIYAAISVAMLTYSMAGCQGLKGKLSSKLPKKDRTEMFQCGHVHTPGAAEKANPMKMLQKGLGGGATSGVSDLSGCAISVFYQANLHPQAVMKYPTSTDGWETCGDAIFLGFTNLVGMGLTKTDGKVTISSANNQEIPYSGIGTYFHGFKPSERGKKSVQITSSDGDKVDVEVSPAKPVIIKSVNGISRGENLEVDGTGDVIIELAGAEDDLDSRIHVQIICKMMGTPIMYDLYVTEASNKITIPKEAFKNFEGSPAPFAKNNILIVNRVSEELIDGTDAGSLRAISAYMDWTPMTIGGDLAKGNVITMGMDSTKNTNIKVTSGDSYKFTLTKGNPFSHPPIENVKNVAVASFVVRGNLSAQQTTSSKYWITKTTKWFPELGEAQWQALADELYAQFESELETKLGLTCISLNQITSSPSYVHTKAIADTARQSYVEVGAGSTRRILTSSSTDLIKDLGITFPSDFVGNRLAKDLDVDAVIAVTIDLDFDFETEGLNPKVRIESYAPGFSYKTIAKHYTGVGTTQGMSLSESKQHSGTGKEVLYKMIKGDAMVTEMVQAILTLKGKEAEMPVYNKLWSNR